MLSFLDAVLSTAATPMTSTELTNAPLASYWLRTPIADSIWRMEGVHGDVGMMGPDRNEPEMITLQPEELSLP